MGHLDARGAGQFDFTFFDGELQVEFSESGLAQEAVGIEKLEDAEFAVLVADADNAEEFSVGSSGFAIEGGEGSGAGRIDVVGSGDRRGDLKGELIALGYRAVARVGVVANPIFVGACGSVKENGSFLSLERTHSMRRWPFGKVISRGTSVVKSPNTPRCCDCS